MNGLNGDENPPVQLYSESDQRHGEEKERIKTLVMLTKRQEPINIQASVYNVPKLFGLPPRSCKSFGQLIIACDLGKNERETTYNLLLLLFFRT